MRLPMAPNPFCWSKSHELATMEHQLEGMVSCHRMVRYEFGWVEIMVRFELDAVNEAAPKSTKTNWGTWPESIHYPVLCEVHQSETTSCPFPNPPSPRAVSRSTELHTPHLLFLLLSKRRHDQLEPSWITSTFTVNSSFPKHLICMLQGTTEETFRLWTRSSLVKES